MEEASEDMVLEAIEIFKEKYGIKTPLTLFEMDEIIEELKQKQQKKKKVKKEKKQ